MKKEEPGNYEDIIHLPHHVSARHAQMPLADRAAQFSPFAALTGHDEAIRETARLTDSYAELDEQQREKLDERLQMLRAQAGNPPFGELEVRVTYFKPDAVKEGGTYVSVSGKVKKVDEYGRQILFADGTAIPLETLFSIEGELFKDMDG